MSLNIGWILTFVSNEVYHEIVDGRNVTYVDLTYGLRRTIELAAKGTMHQVVEW